jgi:hypothetical protein
LVTLSNEERDERAFPTFLGGRDAENFDVSGLLLRLF